MDTADLTQFQCSRLGNEVQVIILEIHKRLTFCRRRRRRRLVLRSFAPPFRRGAAVYVRGKHARASERRAPTEPAGHARERWIPEVEHEAGDPD
jgi:hypothetical protein